MLSYNLINSLIRPTCSEIKHVQYILAKVDRLLTAHFKVFIQQYLTKPFPRSNLQHFLSYYFLQHNQSSTKNMQKITIKHHASLDDFDRMKCAVQDQTLPRTKIQHKIWYAKHHWCTVKILFHEKNLYYLISANSEGRFFLQLNQCKLYTFPGTSLKFLSPYWSVS